eukprot:1895454-Pyramimonas_sp.AAC.2
MLCIISSSILSPRSSKLDVEGLTESALCAGTIRQRLAGTASSAADMAGHALVSMVAFSSMLTLTQVCDARVVKNVSLADVHPEFTLQVVGLASRISCATPIVSSVLGTVGVGAASIVASRSAD